MSLYNMFRALKAHLQEETVYICGIWYVILYESSLWLIGAQLEWELSQFPLKLCTDRPQGTLLHSDVPEFVVAYRCTVEWEPSQFPLKLCTYRPQ